MYQNLFLSHEFGLRLNMLSVVDSLMLELPKLSFILEPED